PSPGRKNDESSNLERGPVGSGRSGHRGGGGDDGGRTGSAGTGRSRGSNRRSGGARGGEARREVARAEHCFDSAGGSARSSGSGGASQAGRIGARDRSRTGPRGTGRATEDCRAGQGGAERVTEGSRREESGSSRLPAELAVCFARREGALPRGIRGDQQDGPGAVGESHSRRAPESPAGASVARRACAEASLGLRDSRGARRVSRGEPQDGPEDQGRLGEGHSRAEEDAGARAPVFRPQGLPPRLGASHSPGEDRFPARPSGAARGVEGPVDRSERLAEAVVRQELPGDGTEELGG